MIRSNIYHHSKICIALWLVGVMLVNTGYQYLDAGNQDSAPLEICDHTDSESECDNKEAGEVDDLITYESKSFHFFSGPITLSGTNTLFNYPPSHLEIISPPPENS